MCNIVTLCNKNMDLVKKTLVIWLSMYVYLGNNFYIATFLI